jgi:hypothetical protein
VEPLVDGTLLQRDRGLNRVIRKLEGQILRT